MADQFTTLFHLTDMDTDSHSNDWGDVTDANLLILEKAIGETTTRSASGGTATLTQTNVRDRVQRITGVLASNQIYEVPAAVPLWWVWINETTGNFTLTVRVTGQTGVVIPQGEARVIRCNGTDVVDGYVLPQSVFNGKAQWLGTLAFTTDAYSNPATAPALSYFTALRDGLRLRAKIGDANATTTPTFNYNSTGAKTIVHSDGSALVIGELAVGLMVDLTYESGADKWFLTYTKLVTPGTITGALTLSGELTPAQITATQNDYAPTGIATASKLYLSADADLRQIRGLSASQTAGRVLILQNVGTKTIKLMDQNTNATAANRFDLGSIDRIFSPGAILPLQYNGTSLRWQVLSTRHMWREADLGAFNDNSTQTTPVSHSLGTYPLDAEVWIECTSTDLGYAVGDRVKIPEQDSVALWMSTTEVGLAMGGGVNIQSKAGSSGQTGSNISQSKWKVILRLLEP